MTIVALFFVFRNLPCYPFSRLSATLMIEDTRKAAKSVRSQTNPGVGGAKDQPAKYLAFTHGRSQVGHVVVRVNQVDGWPWTRVQPGRWNGALVVLLLWVLCKPLVLVSISAYQRFISPHKGWCCAYAALHGGPSCSAYGRRLSPTTAFSGERCSCGIGSAIAARPLLCLPQMRHERTLGTSALPLARRVKRTARMVASADVRAAHGAAGRTLRR